jgi:general secretion pathway protein H
MDKKAVMGQMPISATGICLISSKRSSLKLVTGFTLIEVLVVLFLMALSSMVMMMNLPLSRGHSAEQAANSFFQRVQLLSEEAILGSHDFGLTIDQAGRQIRFSSLTDQGWVALESDRMSASLALADDVTLDLQLGSQVWHGDEAGVNSDTLFDESDKNSAEQPELFILSSGDLTPFLAIFTTAGESVGHGWKVQVKENGVIRLLTPNESIDE